MSLMSAIKQRLTGLLDTTYAEMSGKLFAQKCLRRGLQEWTMIKQ